MAPWNRRKPDTSIRVLSAPPQVIPGRGGALTAAARRVDVGDRAEARRMRALRQGWQSDAWTYRDAIGELRYAVNFLSNCAKRMRLYPAAYPTGGETDKPEPLEKVSGIPPEVASLAEQALIDLGHGKLALQHIMGKLSSNLSVAGECWLFGTTDEETGEARWSVRSVDELIIRDDRYVLREVPADQQGIIPWIELDLRTTVLSRIWLPHPRFGLLADSPMRAMLDDTESLTILRRGIRATGRSRLATGGLLLVPNEVSMKPPIDDNGDPQADPFMGSLAEAMMEPIADEGVASAVVPIVLRGPADALKEVRRIDMAGQHTAEDAKVREELIGIVATTFDLPKDVITGMLEANHWTAWQIDDSTFRHHVEPHVIDCCDCLTTGYMQQYLENEGVDRAIARRVVVWYDATELVTHPDQTKDALDLHDRLVISNDAMLRVAGFEQSDQPDKAEFMVRLLHNMRTWPPNVVMAAIHALDPSLNIPAILQSGTIPGVSAKGVEIAEPEAPTNGSMPAPPITSTNGQIPPATAAPGHDPTPPEQRQLPAPPSVASGWASGHTDELEQFLEKLRTVVAAAPTTDEEDPQRTFDAIFALASGGGYGDMWINDEERRVYVVFGDWEGDLASAACALAEREFSEYSVEGVAEGGDPSKPRHYDEATEEVVEEDIPGWRQIYAKGERVGDLESPKPVVASTTKLKGKGHRLSQRLVAIDQDLRARLQVAANQAMLLQLERAGQRMRKVAARDERLRAKIAHKPTWTAVAALGPDVVTAAGLSADELLGKSWNTLREKFYAWTKAAQTQAIATARKLAYVDDAATAQAEKAMAAGLDSGWELLASTMTDLAHSLLYNPDPNNEGADLNPDTLVPTGLIRAALGLAGGNELAQTTSTGTPVEVGVPVGQIGTGATVSELIEQGGGEREAWEFVHGAALNPFEPHEELDGVRFAAFDDERLANNGDFPENAYFFPGDHAGCSCDYLPIYLAPDEVETPAEESEAVP